jgi:hypothetical protein
MRCRAVLTIAIGRWNQGAQVSAEAVNGKDPVERIKRLMQLCHDELPPPEPELNFMIRQQNLWVVSGSGNLPRA